MKRVILISLCIVCFYYVNGQVNDKIQHFTTASTLTFMGSQSIEGLTGWKYSGEAAAVGVFAAGLYKEYRMDIKPSGGDIAANFAGVMVGYYVNRVINRKLAGRRVGR